ncbi:uncharacterized protein LOC135827458 [Sycon ciliatum]|uniref:uncharacterized protein LOC135827458 n=1 Tax=Sycon ciliatum TaxID=27933 RepID=UPI0031F618EE
MENQPICTNTSVAERDSFLWHTDPTPAQSEPVLGERHDDNGGSSSNSGGSATNPILKVLREAIKSRRRKMSSQVIKTPSAKPLRVFGAACDICHRCTRLPCTGESAGRTRVRTDGSDTSDCNTPGLNSLITCTWNLADFQRYSLERLADQIARLHEQEGVESVKRSEEQAKSSSSSVISGLLSDLSENPYRLQRRLANDVKGDELNSMKLNRADTFCCYRDLLKLLQEHLHELEQDKRAESERCPCCPSQLRAHRECLLVWHEKHALSALGRTDERTSSATSSASAPDVVEENSSEQRKARKFHPHSREHSVRLCSSSDHNVTASTSSPAAGGQVDSVMSTSGATEEVEMQVLSESPGASTAESDGRAFWQPGGDKQDLVEVDRDDGRSGAESPGGSGRSLSDLRRRLRTFVTPPRLPQLSSVRRAGSGHSGGGAFTGSRSASSTPDIIKRRSGTDVDGGGSSGRYHAISHVRQGSRSCEDLHLQNMEGIFEPRLAPYTPAAHMTENSPRLSDANVFRTFTPDPNVDEVARQRLESYLFEPRDVICTPPLTSNPALVASVGPLRPQSTDCAVPSSSSLATGASAMLKIPDLSPRQKRRSFPGYAFDLSKHIERAPFTKEELRAHMSHRRSVAQETSRALMGLPPSQTSLDDGTSPVFEPVADGDASISSHHHSDSAQSHGSPKAATTLSPHSPGGANSAGAAAVSRSAESSPDGGGDGAFVRLSYQRSSSKVMSPLALADGGGGSAVGMTTPGGHVTSPRERHSARHSGAGVAAVSGFVLDNNGGGGAATPTTPVLTVRRLEQLSASSRHSSAASSLATTPLPLETADGRQLSSSSPPRHHSTASDCSSSSNASGQAVLARG